MLWVQIRSRVRCEYSQKSMDVRGFVSTHNVLTTSIDEILREPYLYLCNNLFYFILFMLVKKKGSVLLIMQCPCVSHSHNTLMTYCTWNQENKNWDYFFLSITVSAFIAKVSCMFIFFFFLILNINICILK